MNMPADQLFDLYWLGYLLTGDRERSVQAVIDTLEMPDVANQFFEGWMVTWSRKIFIAKVLGYVVSESAHPNCERGCDAWSHYRRRASSGGSTERPVSPNWSGRCWRSNRSRGAHCC